MNISHFGSIIMFYYTRICHYSFWYKLPKYLSTKSFYFLPYLCIEKVGDLLKPVVEFPKEISVLRSPDPKNGVLKCLSVFRLCCCRCWCICVESELAQILNQTDLTTFTQPRILDQHKCTKIYLEQFETNPHFCQKYRAVGNFWRPYLKFGLRGANNQNEHFDI